MLDLRENEINDSKCQLKILLSEEEHRNGGYEQWYAGMSDFRNSLRRYIKFNYLNKMYREIPMILSNGHLVDHHIISYFAPLDYKRRGWGNKYKYPYQQIAELSYYFKRLGKRFIYVPLPNKGVIYPELITNIKELKDYNSPQWRKYIMQLVEEDVEIIDGFSVFNKCKNHGNKELFSKGHHISSYGAKMLGKSIAEYLLKTTKGILPCFDIEEEVENWLYFDGDYICGERRYPETLYMHYVKEGKYRSPYYLQGSKESSIAIVGDCNLQNYETYGGGISAATTFYLKYPIHNIGRHLPFDSIDSMTEDTIKMLQKKEIIIYVAFASASFVRTSRISYRRLGRPYNWSTIDLEKIS